VSATTTATGSAVTCPKCDGRGYWSVWDRSEPNGGYNEDCDACSFADPCYVGSIMLPVAPAVRDALGEELMVATGLEWDGLCGGQCACECWSCWSERAESEAA
jgi:hypothetical protein